MIRRDCEVGSTDAHRSCEKSESNSLGASSKVLIEDGDGEIKKLGSTVLNPTEPNVMHHDPMEEVVGKKGDRGLGKCSLGASI